MNTEWSYAFQEPKSRRDIIRIGTNLAKYLHKNKIHNIMFIDCSARMTYLALHHAWKKEFPKEKSPQIYFINPYGCLTKFWKRNLIKVAEEFDKTYTHLAKNKEQNIALFDICVHSGDAIKPIIRTLNKAGYENIEFILAQPCEANKKKLKKLVKYHTTNNYLELGCKPFGLDESILKEPYEFISRKNYDSTEIKESIENRRMISKIFASNH